MGPDPGRPAGAGGGPGPAPGGGSVVAVTATPGCALVLMAREITAWRDPSATATERPLTAAANAVAASEWAFGVLPAVSGTVVSDVRAGTDLLVGSTPATLRGAEANVAQPGEDAAAFTARLDAVRRAAEAAHARIETEASR